MKQQAAVAKRRAAVAAAVIAVAAQTARETRAASHFEPRLDFEKFTLKLNTEPGVKFYNMFRMQSFSFNKLCILLEPHCQKYFRMSNLRTKGDAVTTELSLHCCI